MAQQYSAIDSRQGSTVSLNSLKIVSFYQLRFLSIDKASLLVIIIFPPRLPIRGHPELSVDTPQEWAFFAPRRNVVAEGGYWITLRQSVSPSVCSPSITLRVLVRI